MNADFPLISVIVITYNSGKYVLETLESIKNQTYENIELIISDDCSKDDTVVMCSRWLQNNSDRFLHSRLIVSEFNKGIPANCNQGLSYSKGDWVKFIAGDDLLLPNCISIFYSESKIVPYAQCLVSQMYVLHGNVVDMIYKPVSKLLPKNSSKQLVNFIRYKSLPGAGLFFNKKVLDEVGRFDERYKGVEDYPVCIKFAMLGYLFSPVNRPTVIYRVHQESITNCINSTFDRWFELYFHEVVKPIIIEKNFRLLLWHYWLREKLTVSCGLAKLLYSWMTRFTDYIYWEDKIMPIFKRTPHGQIKIKKIDPVSLSVLMVD